MTNCRQARAWIARELDRELSVDEALALDEHVGACRACRGLSQRANALEEALLRLAEPPSERLDIEHQVRAIRRRLAHEPAPARRTLVRRLAWSGLAAAAVVVSIAVWPSAASAPPVAIVPAPDAEAVKVAPVAVATTVVDPAPQLEPERSVLEPERSIEVAPPVEADPQPDDAPAFDAARRAAVHERVREILRVAAVELPALATNERARALADAVDRAAREPDLAGWPIARLAAAMIDDPDTAVRRAAARYVGLRGDRLAQLALERRAPSDDEALLARLDSADAASEAIAAACVDERRGALALERLAEWPVPERAAMLQAALRRECTARARTATLEGLVACGEPAVEALLRLTQSGALSSDSAFGALERVPGAAHALAELCANGRERFDVELLVDAVVHLRAVEALPWLEAMERDPRRRASATRGLIAFATPQSFESLLDPWNRGWIDASAVDEALRRLAEQGDAVLISIAEHATASKDAWRVPAVIDALIARGGREVAPALTRFVAAATLAGSERELAARAVADLGDERDIAPLAEAFRTLERRDRRLAAVCIDALQRLGGRTAVDGALAGAGARQRARVLEVLERPSPGTVSLVQLARALEPVLERETFVSVGDQP